MGRFAAGRRAVGAAVLVGATVLGVAPAQALKINLINTGGAEEGTLARQGFDAAAGFWSSVFSDDVTVNLEVGFGHLGPDILGSTGSNTQTVLVSDVYAALAADAKTGIDARAVANLRPLRASTVDGLTSFGAVDAVTSAYADPATRSGIDTTKTILDNDGGANNTVLDANTATLKALGFDIDPATIDGSVTFSSDFAFDFRPINGITANQTDFIAVAIHEIGHALGFVSGVDTYDVYGDPNSPPIGAPFPDGFTYSDLLKSGYFGSADLGDFAILSPLDLFRYSDAGLDWSVGTASRFSIDGGAALFGNSGFSTGTFNGDGWQASHWKAPQLTSGPNAGAFSCALPKLGILNPYICDGQAGIVTDLDLAAFDAIGWDVNFDVAANPGFSINTAQIGREFNVVPEPATWALMIGGFGIVGASLRRQRRTGYATA